jgi:Zn-dependent protease with chaperone function
MRTISILTFLFLLCAVFFVACATTPKAAPQQSLAQNVSSSLLTETRKSYSQLFQDSLKLHYSHDEIQSMVNYLDKSKDYCTARYKDRAVQYDRDLRRESMELYQVGGRLNDTERTNRHCQIQNLRILKSRAEIYSDQAIPVAYENRQAKLQLIEHWPSEYRQIQQELASGAYRNRRWANVKDIGYRVVQEGQKDDIETGLKAIQELRRTAAIPPEIENSDVTNYVQKVADNIGRHSDLQVPIHVTVLNSKEINAFALPGGFLYVQRGLLEAAHNESELAGVISHEIAHDAARHGHRLMKKANVANVFLQAARIAGAIAGGPWYYGLGYGSMGLGLAMNLNLLGKSREFELEADQLGIQYSWAAGYDPDGFLNFFDRMASQKGYVRSTSWFRTHPAFYERMVNAKKEITFLPPSERSIVDKEDFEKMQLALADIPVPASRPDPRAYSQVMVPQQDEKCAPPPETQQGGVQYLEDVCGVE